MTRRRLSAQPPKRVRKRARRRRRTGHGLKMTLDLNRYRREMDLSLGPTTMAANLALPIVTVTTAATPVAH